MLQERTEIFPINLPSIEVSAEPITPFILRNKDDINLIPDGTSVVYLQNQKVASLAFVESLLELHFLKSIIFQPCQGRMIGPGMKALLAEKEIEVRFERRIDKPYYDQTDNNVRGYEEKLAVWELAWEDPKKQEILKIARDHLPEYKILELYFSGENLSLREVAERLNLPHYYVQRNFAAFMHIAGLKSLDHNTRCRARQIEADITKIRLEQMGMNTQKVDLIEEKRKSFAVDGEFPPQTLRQDKWEDWQKIKIATKNDRKLWSKLKKIDPRCGYALDSAYHLGKYYREKMTFRKVGKKFGVSDTRIWQLKNQALVFLKLR